METRPGEIIEVCSLHSVPPPPPPPPPTKPDTPRLRYVEKYGLAQNIHDLTIYQLTITKLNQRKITYLKSTLSGRIGLKNDHVVKNHPQKGGCTSDFAPISTWSPCPRNHVFVRGLLCGVVNFHNRNM